VEGASSDAAVSLSVRLSVASKNLATHSDISYGSYTRRCGRPRDLTQHATSYRLNPSGDTLVTVHLTNVEVQKI